MNGTINGRVQLQNDARSHFYQYLFILTVIQLMKVSNRLEQINNTTQIFAIPIQPYPIQKFDLPGINTTQNYQQMH